MYAMHMYMHMCVSHTVCPEAAREMRLALAADLGPGRALGRQPGLGARNGVRGAHTADTEEEMDRWRLIYRIVCVDACAIMMMGLINKTLVHIIAFAFNRKLIFHDSDGL